MSRIDPSTDLSLDALCVNTLRCLAIDMIEQAASGHPGLPLGAAPMATMLWRHHLVFDPADPDWPDRDRFVLSAGHGSALLYALLHLSGYDLGLEDLRRFRQWGSRTPGHPERCHTPGVEVTTGPLGQGTANAVGMAMAERHLAHRFNQPGQVIVDHRTWALVSEGDLMEGVAAEACGLAGHLHLGKLTYLYDANGVTLDGPASLAFSEDVATRFSSYGWQVLEVADGDRDLGRIDAAIEEARADDQQPSLIIVHTTLGYGSPNRAGRSAAHGSTLGAQEAAATKQALGWEWTEPFTVPAQARAAMGEAATRGAGRRAAWRERVAAWREACPQDAAEWERRQRGELPADWDRDLPNWEMGEKVATRVAGGRALVAIAARVPELIGGDADLSSSTKTAVPEGGSFDGATGVGRNIHFGVREHAMGAIANGMAAHGGVRPYVSTFLCFSDYMRPAVRLAAMSRLPVIYVWTHDSVGVGEDGPTHQPVEHVMALRVIPDLVVFRPGDPNEAAEAWRWAMTCRDRPVAFVLSRQGLPVVVDPAVCRDGVGRGAYVAAEAEGSAARIILMATGSELALACAARARLQELGHPTRVVSMPSLELFAQQEAAYRDRVLPDDGAARVAIEAGVTLGWERWVGRHGAVIGIDRFGASAPGATVMAELGLHAERVVETACGLLAGRGLEGAVDDR